MSLPKPDVHVRLTDEAAYWPRVLSAVESRPASDIARELLLSALLERGEKMTAIASRLVADGRVRSGG